MKAQTKTIIRPAASKVVDALKERVKTDPLFNAIMHRFAIRERARNQVTLTNLRITMIKEGYSNFPVTKYQEALKFLASLGFGRLETNASGKVTALVDIRHTLQSIGQVASDMKGAKLEGFTPANVYEPLQEPAGRVVPEVDAPKPVAPETPSADYPAVLQVTIDGKVVHFPLPRAISPAELGFLLADLYSGDIKALTGGTQQ